MICNYHLNMYRVISVVLLIFPFHNVIGNVLEESYPIIFNANTGQKQNSDNIFPESYFGYTVSLATGNSYKTSEDPDGWIFIGAPKANASIPNLYSRTSIQPGVIWRCSLGRRSDRGDTCEIMNIDPSIQKRPNGPAYESHDGACVGISMEINFGHFLTCGMRWNRGQNNFYNGICYWFPDKTSSIMSSYRSNDLSKLVDLNKYDQRLTPFFRTKIDQDKIFYYNPSKNENITGYEWQIGQAGISVHLFHDRNTTARSSPPNLLIGAPGLRDWSGGIVLYTNPNAPRPDLARPNRNTNDPTFSEFVIGNRGAIPKPGESKVDRRDDYFGYSVTSGNYLNQGEHLYAAGAPRAEHIGQVIIFELPPYQEPTSTYKRQITPILEMNPPAGSFGSYFGSVLHSVDLDEDGLHELIVGAPLHTFPSSDESKDTGEPNTDADSDSGESDNFQGPGDHGCVYVYKFNETNVQLKPMQTLFGSKRPQARFGSAITTLTFNLRNSNETNEIYIVIGAPYEDSESQDDSSSGAVYLYLYNSKTKEFGNYVQRIVASSISSSLKGFGCSFSIPQDIDLNQTPDIAIGSYKSDHAVLLRTRPKIMLQGWITFSYANGNPIEKEILRGIHKFRLRSCFVVYEKLGHVAPKLDIWVKVKILDPTIEFDTQGDSKMEVIYQIPFFANSSANCRDFTVKSLDSNGVGMDGSDTLIEIKDPLFFEQEVWYDETLNRSLTILNVDIKGSKAGPATGLRAFEKEKPSPERIKTSQKLPIALTDCQGSICLPNISISWSFFNENNETVLSTYLGLTKIIRLQIIISNSGDTAAKPNFVIDWNIKDIKESSVGPRWLQRRCKPRFDTTIVAYFCQLGQYIKKGRTITIDIQLSTADVFAHTPNQFQFNVNGGVTVEIGTNHPQTFYSKASLLVVPRATTVAIIGSRENGTLSTSSTYFTLMEKDMSQTESSNQIRKQTTLYAPFRQRFTIEVFGAFVKNVNAHFKLPVVQEGAELAKGAQLLLVKQPHTQSNGVKCIAAPGHNFYKVDSLDASNQIGVKTNHQQNKNLVDSEDVHVDPVHRRKRDVNDTEHYDDSQTTITPIIAIDWKPKNLPKSPEKMVVGKDAFKLACDGSEKNCIEVNCTAENVKSDSPIYISFEMYFVKDVIDKILKESDKESIFIESKGFVQIFDGMANHGSSDWAQTAIKQISVKEVETWVYIVAGVSGILLLFLIIFGFYKCGFFKREKRQQLNNMKAEHYRKSMIAAARHSIAHSTGGDGNRVSLEELTEAEHRNEDNDSGSSK